MVFNIAYHINLYGLARDFQFSNLNCLGSDFKIVYGADIFQSYCLIQWSNFLTKFYDLCFFIVIHIRISTLSSVVIADVVSVIDAQSTHLYLAGRDHCASG